jgi:hypothetical protein
MSVDKQPSSGTSDAESDAHRKLRSLIQAHPGLVEAPPEAYAKAFGFVCGIGAARPPKPKKPA